MVEWTQVIPIIAVLVGTLMSILLGVMTAKLTGMEQHMREANGRCREHDLNQPRHLNPNSFDKLDEQIKTLYNTVRLAHERIDVVKGKG